MTHDLVIDQDGVVRFIHADALQPRELGEALGGAYKIRRASHVEPTDDGLWTADMTPVDGPVLGPFETRTDALREEVEYLRAHHLGIAS